MSAFRLALAQVNPRVGDLEGNARIVLEWSRRAHDAGADLVAFPEMMLTGYPIEDLALRDSFVEASRAAPGRLAAELAGAGLGDLPCVIGYVDRVIDAAERLGVPKGSPQNSLAVLHGGEVVTTYAKRNLPNYGVFDEYRYFVPGDIGAVVEIAGVNVSLLICEDLWQEGPIGEVRKTESDLVLVINGSPYEAKKDDSRLELCARRAAEAACALAYVNMVGGQDELVYDGDSIVVSETGEVLARAHQFVDELLVVDLELPKAARPEATGDVPDEVPVDVPVRRARVPGRTVTHRQPIGPAIAEPICDEEERYTAIVTGLRDYVHKNGFTSALLGMSGGIDSTLVAQLACDALGPENVHGVSNPSAHSSQHSVDDAAEHARRTGLHLRTVPIETIVSAYQDQLGLTGLALENLQARIRAVIWMGLSNQEGHLVLACSNKSELSVGYSTIYGDAVGAFAPIKDLWKTQVWQLARWRNAAAEARGEQPPIPEHAIAKAPSAELSPGQLDTDSLPPYDLLDDMLDDYVEQYHGSRRLIDDGFDPALVERVLRLVDLAEYKRRQFPPGPKLSVRNFGRDRRLPITNAWREVVAPPD